MKREKRKQERREKKREKEKERREKQKERWIHCNGESTSAKRTTLTFLFPGKNLGYTFTSGLWQNLRIEYRCLAQRPRTSSEERSGAT